MEIKEHEVMELLLKASPSYLKRWEEYIQDNYSDTEERLLYVDLGDFAIHLVDLYKSNKIEEFQDVFWIIEQLHVDGDRFVKEAATIGLLEAIQNVSSNSDLDQDVFLTYLNTESLKWWDQLNNFWVGVTETLDGDNA